eukprot:2222474-Rhodomonas_salina.2
MHSTGDMAPGSPPREAMSPVIRDVPGQTMHSEFVGDSIERCSSVQLESSCAHPLGHTPKTVLFKFFSLG